jgi:type IV secretory pathway component VirB8
MKMKKKLNDEYLNAGKDWYFDRYEAVKIQGNRWFVGFLASTTLSIVLVITLTLLFPLKTLVPLVIHQNKMTGEVWVTHPKSPYVPENDAEVQADIVRFITTYKSYTATDINQRFNLVKLLSANLVARQYADEQSNNNKTSPVNTLGVEGTRTVRVEDIVFIDKAGTQEKRPFKKAAVNLAKVDFITLTTDHAGNKKRENWVATISWVYKGLPDNQQDAWDNWSGFTVTSFRIDPKNMG